MVRWNRRSSAVVDMAVSWSNRNTTHQSHAILTDPILTLKKKNLDKYWLLKHSNNQKFDTF